MDQLGNAMNETPRQAPTPALISPVLTLLSVGAGHGILPCAFATPTIDSAYEPDRLLTLHSYPLPLNIEL